MREKGARRERGEAFVLKTSMNTETRATHIYALERAAHVFSS